MIMSPLCHDNYLNRFLTVTEPPASQRGSGSMHSSTLPTLNETIRSNIAELARLAKELEDCSQTIQKVTEVRRHNSCPSGFTIYRGKTKRSNTYDNKATEVLDEQLTLANGKISQNSPEAGTSIDSGDRGQSAYEILDVAQQNLYLAILAKEQYDLICQDLSLSLDIEEKIVVTKAKELNRKSKAFEKMTEDAIQKLSSFNICPTQ